MHHYGNSSNETLRKRGIQARVMPEESFFLKPLTSELEEALSAQR